MLQFCLTKKGISEKAQYLPGQEIKVLHRNLVISRSDHWFIPSENLSLTSGKHLMFKTQEKATFESTFSCITLQRKNVLMTYVNSQLMPCSRNRDYFSYHASSCKWYY